MGALIEGVFIHGLIFSSSFLLYGTLKLDRINFDVNASQNRESREPESDS